MCADARATVLPDITLSEIEAFALHMPMGGEQPTYVSLGSVMVPCGDLGASRDCRAPVCPACFFYPSAIMPSMFVWLRSSSV